MNLNEKYNSIISDAMQNVSKQDAITVELTPTNACNCQCKYCFEQDHSMHPIDEQMQIRQIKLLHELCQKFDPAKFKNICIVFWGGEPMLNKSFVESVVNETQQYEYVSYMMYSNGTLFSAFEEFTKKEPIIKNSYRFEVQLSYDGEPHHTLMRGNNSSDIIKTAHLLIDSGFIVSFKPTLSFSMIDHFEEAWKSYEKLYDEFGEIVRYCPTLDTSNKGLTDDLVVKWHDQLIKIAKHEYSFIKKHGHSLISWYNPFIQKKMSCSLNYHIAINTDGNIYLCHGCFYSKHKDSFEFGNINTISSLYETLNKLFVHSSPNELCIKCGAMFCNVCHVSQVNPKDFINDWDKCKPANKLRCKCFKEFSKIFNALTFALIDNNCASIFNYSV